MSVWRISFCFADVSKRQRQPHPLTWSALKTLLKQLDEPLRTTSCVCVCFGLRISECLALGWSDINWLEGKLSIQRCIVRQRVGDVKTSCSKKTMPIDSEMLRVLESWRARTQFSSDEDWVFCFAGAAWQIAVVSRWRQRCVPKGHIDRQNRPRQYPHYAAYLPLVARRCRYVNRRSAKADAARRHPHHDECLR